jgi:hypothetical protein
MKLRDSGKAAIVVSTLVGSTQVLAKDHEHKVDFYGSVETAYNSYTRKEIDVTKAAVGTAYANAPGEKGPVKDENYSSLSSGYATSQFGVNYKASDKVTGTLEFEVGLGDAAVDMPPAVRKYFFDVDLGAGLLKFGRDDRIFSGVAGAADNFSMANSTYAGTLYGEERGTGISYSTGALLGPATIKLGLVNPTTGNPASEPTGMPESKPNGGNPEPTIEASVGFSMGGFGADIAVVSEKRTYGWTKEAPTWDVANTMGYSLALTANVAMIEAALVYTGGDALYDNVVQGAAINKDQNDKMSGVALNVMASFDDLSVGLYYGMETLTRDKKNTGSDKDMDDVGTTIGLSAGYAWKGVTWTGEIATTTRAYDGETIRDDMYGAIGAMTSFKS